MKNWVLKELPPSPTYLGACKIGKLIKIITINLNNFTTPPPPLTLIISYCLSLRSPIIKINHMNRDSMGGINTCTFIPYRKLCSFPDPRVYTDIQGASGQNPFLLILCEKGDNFLCTTFVITQLFINFFHKNDNWSNFCFAKYMFSAICL